VQQRFARGGKKGDGVAGEASGGGRWWWLKGERVLGVGVVVLSRRRSCHAVERRSFNFFLGLV